MEKREEVIRRWFSMWLEAKDSGIEEIFAPDAVYIESWGPEYRGAALIRHWFTEWNTSERCCGGISGSFSTRGTRRPSSGTLKTGWATVKSSPLKG